MKTMKFDFKNCFKAWIPVLSGITTGGGGLLVLFLFATPSVQAEVSGGLTLLQAPGARASALGEAFSAVTNDVTAFSYNPASLRSLQTAHASLYYEKGLAEDSYGQFLVGAPFAKAGLGLSVGYYNGGSFDKSQNGHTTSVSAQKDMSLALGYARSTGPLMWGVTGKYLTSTIVETYKASAYAFDAGLMLPMGSRLHLGAAVQNIGTQLTYVSQGDSLPRVARLGASYKLFSGRTPTLLLVDAPYDLNESAVHPGVGLEAMVGPMALRAGFKTGSDLSEFSVGTGFMLGRTSVDYSFGLVKDLSSQHQLSVAFRFGGGAGALPSTVDFASTVQSRQAVEPPLEKPVSHQQKQKPTNDANALSLPPSAAVPAAAAVTVVPHNNAIPPAAGAPKPRRLYTVREGDTLEKIAKKVNVSWKLLYDTNKHLLDDDKNLVVGQKLILP